MDQQRQRPVAVYNRAVRSANILLLVGVSVLTFFVGIGLPAISDSDEAFYAQAGREMIESGDWLTPRYNGLYRFEKPVLFYWLTALCYLLIGVTETAARAPSAVAGILLALATYGCARRWYDPSTALLAGTITATSFGYTATARQALPDLALACFITVATWAALVALVAPRPSGPDPARRLWLTLSGFAIAGGFLTKGPVGVVLPGLVVGPLALWRCYSEVCLSKDTPWSPPRKLFGDLMYLSILSLALAAPWFVAMTASHGTSYLDRFFIAENLQRFATERYNAPRPIWYYFPIVVGGLFPWSPLMLLWSRSLRGLLNRVRHIQPTEIWLGAWALTPLLFYSVSIGKQPRYILPILPPLAILIARALSRSLNPTESPRRCDFLTIATVSSGAVLILLGGLILRAHVLLPAVSPASMQLAAAVIVGSGAGVVMIALSSLKRFIPIALTVASILTTLTVHSVVLAGVEPEPVQEMAAMVRSAGPESLPYGRYRVFVRNLIFYTGRPHVDLASEEQVRVFLESSEPVLCVIAEADLARVVTPTMPVYELGRVEYLNTGALTLRALLWPDPMKDIQTVLLVTNRPPNSLGTAL